MREEGRGMREEGAKKEWTGSFRPAHSNLLKRTGYKLENATWY
jgi:hypothetical protein